MHGFARPLPPSPSSNVVRKPALWSSSSHGSIPQALDICKTLSVSYNEMKDRTGIVHRAQSMKLDYNKDMGAGSFFMRSIFARTRIVRRMASHARRSLMPLPCLILTPLHCRDGEAARQPRLQQLNANSPDGKFEHCVPRLMVRASVLERRIASGFVIREKDADCAYPHTAA